LVVSVADRRGDRELLVVKFNGHSLNQGNCKKPDSNTHNYQPPTAHYQLGSKHLLERFIRREGAFLIGG